MSFAFIDKSNVQDAYQESTDYMRAIFEPYAEYERLARNEPHPDIPSHLPRVTEGTLSSTIYKQPRRVIQQTPTGKVIFTDDEGLQPVLQVYLDEYILPRANTGGSILQKGWQSTTRALTYGSQPIETFYTQSGKSFHADCRLPYIKDVLHEKGQTVGGDSNLEFVEKWYTETQLKQILKTERMLELRSKERGDNPAYKSSWVLGQLEYMLDQGPEAKPADRKTPEEVAKNLEAGGYKIVVAYQKGIDAEFYSFAPALGDKDKKAPIVRIKKNPNPDGDIPLRFQYHTVDGDNPNGRGAVAHSGPMQNYIDSYLQLFQYGEILRNDPPLKVWGDLPNSKFIMAPGKVWRLGKKDEGNDVQSVTVAEQSGQFAENLGMFKAILLTGLNGQDTSIGSESGQPGFSRTPAGVKQAQSVLGVDDNYIRKQYETAWALVFQDLLNTEIVENKGRREMILEGDQLEKLVTLYPELGENGGRLDLIFDKINTTCGFRIDAGTSAGEDDSNQDEVLNTIITDYAQNQLVQAKLEEEGYEFSVGEAYRQKVIKSGVEDPEKIIRKLSDEEIQQRAAQRAAEAQAVAGQTTQPSTPAGVLPQADEQEPAIPTQAEQVEEAGEDDPTTAAAGLQDLGLDDGQTLTALQMLMDGKTPDDVMAELGLVHEDQTAGVGVA